MSLTAESEDNEHSFEMITESMSIVTLPDDQRSDMNSNTTASTASATADGHQVNGMPIALQMSTNGGSYQLLVNSDHDLDNRRMESIGDSLPKYDELSVGVGGDEHHLLLPKMSAADCEATGDERAASLRTMSDNLSRIEDNVKNCSKQMDSVLTNNLEIYLKELRDENEKLKTELEKNNEFMKQQIKSLHDWHTKNNEIIDDHKRVAQQAKHLAQENARLTGDNCRLVDKVAELEGMAGLKLVEEMSTELATLRSKCDQMGSYEKLDMSSELKVQDLSSRLVESQMKMDSMREEINSLTIQLVDSVGKLDEMSAMKSQLLVFERDFKLEEMSKMAALKEAAELEATVEELKNKLADMEERLERGAPAVDLKSSAEELTGQKFYTCPKCWRRFERFQAIQNHYRQCLDEDGLFI